MNIKWKNVKDYPLGRMDRYERTEKAIVKEFTLFEGYEDFRLYAVALANGGYQHFIANIDENGTLCDEYGDDVGWTWCEVTHWADFNSPLEG